ncbi:gamma-glutamyltransferase [Cryptococcus neoformans]|nr:gamma-glutamyltransferase [Cryptococcus neoformans var. grubii]OWZ69899.1 gamma-glutamyltransferase [Cryptococcus neoformans var. grubii]OWZ75513.1 gamma-glutamyltransferase [Cryptococcus neoformans var. grubii Bt85]OXG15231.1 gamma-glutamyltransferase [Cryptococcus neoformans var. grubii Tu401-1]OXM77925.1 gamma-glutamyltransferase [Cryptococcus neoformans var. grubii Bt63]
MAPINHSRLHPSYNPQFSHFPSRRSTVFSTKGAVATSQPLAAQAGLEVLNKGGNAADAAVATAAALNVCEPSMTGIGGDVFCLFYDAASKTVKGVNGSGRSPKALSLEYLRSQGITGDAIPLTDLNSVTVPGAAAGWLKTIEEFGSGKLSMREILDPAIRLAREGVPQHELSSNQWQIAEQLIKEASSNWREMMMPDGNPPQPSYVMTHNTLADTLEEVAEHGHDGFYKGRIAQAIVDLVKSGGGVMTLEDLAECTADVIQPISYTFKPHHSANDEESSDPGLTLWECPPNGQGITALIALGIIEAVEEIHGIDVLEIEHNGKLYLHILIESLRLAFADTRYYVTDPDVEHVPMKELLSKEYLRKRASLIDLTKSSIIKHGTPVQSSDTVYLATADKEGNSCSFIASNYAGFGTGAIPKGCGFTLQNRGTGFTLIEGHPNCIKGGKRPYHTIIPGMVTHGDDLMMSFGVMGGFMQPQGHIQVLLNKLRGFSNQSTLDAPRFCISAGLPDNGVKNAEQGAGDIDSEIWFEDGIDRKVIEELRAMGHQCEIAEDYERKIAGKGQIIQRVVDPNGRRVWACGSDLRGDGCAVGQV